MGRTKQPIRRRLITLVVRPRSPDFAKELQEAAQKAPFPLAACPDVLRFIAGFLTTYELCQLFRIGDAALQRALSWHIQETSSNRGEFIPKNQALRFAAFFPILSHFKHLKRLDLGPLSPDEPWAQAIFQTMPETLEYLSLDIAGRLDSFFKWPGASKPVKPHATMDPDKMPVSHTKKAAIKAPEKETPLSFLLTRFRSLKTLKIDYITHADKSGLRGYITDLLSYVPLSVTELLIKTNQPGAAKSSVDAPWPTHLLSLEWPLRLPVSDLQKLPRNLTHLDCLDLDESGLEPGALPPSLTSLAISSGYEVGITFRWDAMPATLKKLVVQGPTIRESLGTFPRLLSDLSVTADLLNDEDFRKGLPDTITCLTIDEFHKAWRRPSGAKLVLPPHLRSFKAQLFWVEDFVCFSTWPVTLTSLELPDTDMDKQALNENIISFPPHLTLLKVGHVTDPAAFFPKLPDSLTSLSAKCTTTGDALWPPKLTYLKVKGLSMPSTEGPSLPRSLRLLYIEELDLKTTASKLTRDECVAHCDEQIREFLSFLRYGCALQFRTVAFTHNGTRLRVLTSPTLHSMCPAVFRQKRPTGESGYTL